MSMICRDRYTRHEVTALRAGGLSGRTCSIVASEAVDEAAVALAWAL
jgi:hypothetical protein